MPENFFMTDEVHAQVMQTITKIEEAQSTQLEIDQLWSEIKNLFCQELNKIPCLPTSNNKNCETHYRGEGLLLLAFSYTYLMWLCHIL